jgi:PST family polysaccharide transporter
MRSHEKKCNALDKAAMRPLSDNASTTALPTKSGMDSQSRPVNSRQQMKDLKEKTIRGGFARLSAQGVNFAVGMGSLVVMARLLGPVEYGLVGMVTAFTGILGLFRDFGLSAAAVQRPSLTDEEASTLFWINMLVGAGLTLLTVAMAPAIAAFYHDSRLLGVTVVTAAGFLFNAAGVQHGAHLQRHMRFTALALVYTGSAIVTAAIGIGAALMGFGYWALVAINVTGPLTITIGCWTTAFWIPQRPRRVAGLRAMMRFGGTLTLNGLVAYVAYNLEKVLLGRFWGPVAIGIYGRAYRLINIPTDNLNVAAGEVTFSALSRLQDQPDRLRNYFLKAYSLVLAITLPLTVAFALFSDDVILVLLGPKWTASVPILRLLAPTTLVLAVINPVGWLMYSIGLVQRSLKLALVFAPIIVIGYVIGLPYGPKGVALGYSAVMMLCAIPLTALCVRGTAVSLRDIVLTSVRPLASAIAAGLLAFGVRVVYGRLLSPFPRLVLESGALLAMFALMILFVAGQKALYLDLLRGLRTASSVQDESLVSV